MNLGVNGELQSRKEVPPNLNLNSYGCLAHQDSSCMDLEPPTH
jgi:hypothetical protein